MIYSKPEQCHCQLPAPICCFSIWANSCILLYWSAKPLTSASPSRTIMFSEINHETFFFATYSDQKSHPRSEKSSWAKILCWNQYMSRSHAALEKKDILGRKSLIGNVSISSRNSLVLFMGSEPFGRWTLINLVLKMTVLHKVHSRTPGKKICLSYKAHKPTRVPV